MLKLMVIIIVYSVCDSCLFSFKSKFLLQEIGKIFYFLICHVCLQLYSTLPDSITSFLRLRILFFHTFKVFSTTKKPDHVLLFCVYFKEVPWF